MRQSSWGSVVWSPSPFASFVRTDVVDKWLFPDQGSWPHLTEISLKVAYLIEDPRQAEVSHIHVKVETTQDLPDANVGLTHAKAAVAFEPIPVTIPAYAFTYDEATNKWMPTDEELNLREVDAVHLKLPLTMLPSDVSVGSAHIKVAKPSGEDMVIVDMVGNEHAKVLLSQTHYSTAYDTHAKVAVPYYDTYWEVTEEHTKVLASLPGDLEVGHEHIKVAGINVLTMVVIDQHAKIMADIPGDRQAFHTHLKATAAGGVDQIFDATVRVAITAPGNYEVGDSHLKVVGISSEGNRNVTQTHAKILANQPGDRQLAHTHAKIAESQPGNWEMAAEHIKVVISAPGDRATFDTEAKVATQGPRPLLIGDAHLKALSNQPGDRQNATLMLTVMMEEDPGRSVGSVHLKEAPTSVPHKRVGTAYLKVFAVVQLVNMADATHAKIALRPRVQVDITQTHGKIAMPYKPDAAYGWEIVL